MQTDTDNIGLGNSLSDFNSNTEIVEDIGIFNIYSDNVIYNDNNYYCGALTSNNINIAIKESHNSNITITIHN